MNTIISHAPQIDATRTLKVKRWLKKEGDMIKPGEGLVEVESDFIVAVITGEHEGVLTQKFFPDGAQVDVGCPLYATQCRFIETASAPKPQSGNSNGESSNRGLLMGMERKTPKSTWIAVGVVFLVLAGFWLVQKIQNSVSPEERRQMEEQHQRTKAALEKYEAEYEAQYGHWPKQNMTTGVVPVVEAYLMGHLKDPSSLSYISWTPLVEDDMGGMKCFSTTVTYRAKNSFGALVIEEVKFYLNKERVLSTGK